MTLNLHMEFGHIHANMQCDCNELLNDWYGTDCHALEMAFYKPYFKRSSQ